MSQTLAETFKERLYLAAGINDESLSGWMVAQDIGVGVTKTIKDRNGIPSAEKLVAIAASVGKSVDWLLGLDKAAIEEAGRIRATDGDQSSEFVYIPRYDVQASAGTGFWALEDQPARFTVAFRRHWIQGYLHANPSDLAVLSVRGDSMAPLLLTGDSILINRSLDRPNDGIYVVRVDEQLLVKRMQRLSKDRMLLISENPAYKPIEWDFADINQMDWDIIGRVVWFGRQI